MPTIVVPFRGPGGKQRLAPLPEDARRAVATAMLADVLAACREVGRTLVVTPGGALEAATAAGADVELVPDPGGGQGAAVEAALARVQGGPVLVVNADLPCATGRDLYALLGALPDGGVAVAEAPDGTTNALALASPVLFEPLYGPGSAARFRRLGSAAGAVPVPNLEDDVDTLDDLRRLSARVGSRTREVLSAIEQRAWAAA